MIFATMFMFFTVAICSTVVIGIYINACKEEGVKMFADPKYEERIEEIEEEILKLRTAVHGLTMEDDK